VLESEAGISSGSGAARAGARAGTGAGVGEGPTGLAPLSLLPVDPQASSPAGLAVAAAGMGEAVAAPGTAACTETDAGRSGDAEIQDMFGEDFKAEALSSRAELPPAQPCEVDRGEKWGCKGGKMLVQWPRLLSSSFLV
jgi:hypothetical protein